MVHEGFVDLAEFCPSLIIAASYATSDNFTGSIVDGYRRKTAYFSLKGAKLLCEVQKMALKENLNLKIYDAYRPEKAVKFFMDWTKSPETNLVLKGAHYPNHSKDELFGLGYIAERSGHSRGSSVDLTLVDIKTNKELDMGTAFDFFDSSSHTNFPGHTHEQKKNRALLMKFMTGNGFKNYDKEWWHYSLIEEAFPGQYFDFDIL